jgi:hypothetical protein
MQLLADSKLSNAFIVAPPIFIESLLSIAKLILLQF